MRRVGDWRLRSTAGMIGGVLAVGISMLTSAAAAAPVAYPRTGHTTQDLQTGPVSPIPASGTPALAPTTTTEQVRQLVECGGIMYAVGSFTEISWNGTTYARNNAFSFSAAAPYTITSWNPSVNGEVNSIALSSDCGHAYIGGSFTGVDGTSVANIANVRTSNGTVVSSWPHSANNRVNTVLLTPNGHLLVGGLFTSINGSTAHKYYASLNPSTGKDDGYLNLNLSGHYVYLNAGFNSTSVYNQQLSPDGGHVLVEGVFTSVQGKARQQIFMLDLGTSNGNANGWTSSEFTQHCSDKHPFYVKAAAWAPDGSTVYIATTGKALYNWNGTYPLTGLCDVVAAFPATHTTVSHYWINYSGCDSFFSAAADQFAVYAGGHERWADNPDGCNFAGTGAIPAPGLGGFTPGSLGGSLLLNSRGAAGLYSRSRGLGADDMLLTSAGLWIASDNFFGADTCGGISGHAGICFLPQ
jgi:polyisoprenoid-binding protein YceI